MTSGNSPVLQVSLSVLKDTAILLEMLTAMVFLWRVRNDVLKNSFCLETVLVVPAAKPEGEQFSSPQPGLSFASQPSFVPQPQAPASSNKRI